MKSLTIFIFIILASTPLYSQQFTENELYGSWIVLDSRLTPEMTLDLDDETQEKMEEMRKGFVGTIFNFKRNKEFTIKFTENIPEFMKELEFLNENKWKIGDGTEIATGNEEDNFSLMRLIVIILEGKGYFIIKDVPITLEVIKQ